MYGIPLCCFLLFLTVFFSYQVIIYLFLGTSKYYPRQIRPQRLLTQDYFQFLVIPIFPAITIRMLNSGNSGSPVLHQGYKLLASCYINTYNERFFAFFHTSFFFTLRSYVYFGFSPCTCYTSQPRRPITWHVINCYMAVVLHCYLVFFTLHIHIGILYFTR